MSPVNTSRIVAFFVCMALLTTRGFAAYIPDDAAPLPTHVLKRAYMGLRLMCEAHPRNCPDGFRKRGYVQNIESGNSYENPESIAKQLEDIIKWRQDLVRQRQTKRSQESKILDVLRRQRYSKRK